MTIDKTIEILNQLERTLAPTMATSGTDAIKLGIEALKRHSLRRDHPKRKFPDLLVGETKEG